MLKNKILLLHYNNRESKQLIQKTLQDVYTSNKVWDFKESILKDLVLRNRYYEMINDWYIEDIGDDLASFEKWYQEFTDHDQYEMLYECLAGIILVVPPATENSLTHRKLCLDHLEQLQSFLSLNGYKNKFFILFDNIYSTETDELVPTQSDNTSCDSQLNNKDDLESFVHPVIDLCSTAEELKNSLDVYDWLDHEENKVVYSLFSEHDNKTTNNKPQLDLAQLLSVLEKEKSHYHSIKDQPEAEGYLDKLIDNMSNLLLDEDRRA
ncbi:hypothetical protein ACO0RG_000409 [Hanseniaspora osmophila]